MDPLALRYARAVRGRGKRVRERESGVPAFNQLCRFHAVLQSALAPWKRSISVSQSETLQLRILKLNYKVSIPTHY
jgi:hypothetical protein